jgi:hypothetical protein
MQKTEASVGVLRWMRARKSPVTRHGFLRWLAMIAVLCVLPPVSHALGADVPDPVLNLMIEKGMITTDEAARVQAQVDALHTNEVPPSSASIWKANKSVKDLEFFGDLRTRFEDRSEEDPSGGNIELQRYRYSARIGLRGDAFDDFYFGFRLDTSSNPRSTWVTMGTTSSGTYAPFSKSPAGINIGEIYLGWHPESWFDITAGKMPNPLYTTPMVWSTAINPEGLAEQFKKTVGQVDFFATFSQFLYQDANPVSASPDLGLGANPESGQSANNIFQVAWQGGFIYHITTNVSFKVAATYYQYFGDEPGTESGGNGITPYFGNDYVGEGAYSGPGSGNPFNGYSGNGTTAVQSPSFDGGAYANNQTGLNDLEVLEVPFELNLQTTRLDYRVFGDFAYNIEGSERATAAAAGYQAYLGLQTPTAATIKGFSPQTSQVKAYQIGAAIGSPDSLGLVYYGANARKHAWEIRTYWQHVEQYSLDPNLLDLDYFAGDENLQGMYAAAAYAFTGNFIGTFRYGYASRIDNQIGTGGTGTDIPQINPITQYQLFQVDLTFKF